MWNHACALNPMSVGREADGDRKKSHLPNKELVRARTLPFAIISRSATGHVRTKLQLLHVMTAFKMNNLQLEVTESFTVVYEIQDKL